MLCMTSLLAILQGLLRHNRVTCKHFSLESGILGAVNPKSFSSFIFYHLPVRAEFQKQPGCWEELLLVSTSRALFLWGPWMCQLSALGQLRSLGCWPLSFTFHVLHAIYGAFSWVSRLPHLSFICPWTWDFLRLVFVFSIQLSMKFNLGPQQILVEFNM